MYRLRWYCWVILSGGRFSELRLIYQWFVYERVGPTRRRTCCVDHNFASRDVDGVGTCEQHNGWTVDTSITTWRILWTNWLNLYAELSQCCTKQKRRMWVNLRILCPTCAAFRSLSLSLLQAVNPSGEGSATRVLLLQSSRSSTSTGVRFRCLSISSSAFSDSDVHTLQLLGYAWCSGHLLVAGHVRTIHRRLNLRRLWYACQSWLA